MAKIQINWRKFWREFQNWCDEHDPSFGGKNYPEWNQQSRKIGQMLISYFPTLNRRKLWRDLDTKFHDHPSSGPDWCVQKRWIRELVRKQIETAEKTFLNTYGTISGAIQRTIGEFNLEPSEILIESECSNFAEAVAKKVPGARPIWDAEIAPREYGEYCHRFIQYEKKYYDASCPNGVTDWRKLPFYKRKFLCPQE